jgi:hypothetical protein
MPLESLQGRKDDLGRTLRVTVRQVVPASQMGEFSVDARQGDVRAVFVPLARMQRELEIEGLVNAVLVSAVPGTEADAIPALERAVRRAASLEDIGLKVRTLDAPRRRRGRVRLRPPGRGARGGGAASGLVVRHTGTGGVYYLANGLRIGNRDIPYSLVTAMDLPRSRLRPSCRLTRCRPWC